MSALPPEAAATVATLRVRFGSIASLRTAAKQAALSTRDHADIHDSFSSPGELQINQIDAAKTCGLPQTLVVGADGCSQKRYPRRAACHTPAQDWPED